MRTPTPGSPAEALQRIIDREGAAAAIRVGEAMLSSSDGSPELAMALALLLTDAGRFARAVALLDGMNTPAAGHSGEHALLRGRALCELGRAQAAAGALAEAWWIAPRREVARTRVHALLRLQEPELAQEAAEEALELFPDDAELQRARLGAMVARGQLAEAASLGRALLPKLEADPDARAEVLRATGRALLMSGHPAEAADHLEQALEQDPLDAKAATALAECLRQEGRHRLVDAILHRTERLLEARTRTTPSDAEAWRRHVGLLLDTMRAPAATSVARAAIRHHPEAPWSRHLLAVALQAARAPDAAVAEALHEVLIRPPMTLEGRRLGSRMGGPVAARAATQAAAELASRDEHDHADAVYDLAFHMLAPGREDAERLAVVCARAEAATRAGRAADAERHWRAAVGLLPRGPIGAEEVRVRLGLALAVAGRAGARDARTLLERADAVARTAPRDDQSDRAIRRIQIEIAALDLSEDRVEQAGVRIKALVPWAVAAASEHRRDAARVLDIAAAWARLSGRDAEAARFASLGGVLRRRASSDAHD